MANARRSGDVFETHFAFVCKLSRVPFSKQDKRITTLVNAAGDSFSIHLTLLISRSLKILQRNYGRITRCRAFVDNDGKNHESGDFSLTFDSGKTLSISLKRNNHDIKAPRPSALDAQLGLDSKDSVKFKEEYKAVTKKWYEAHKNKKLFKNVSSEDRLNLLSNVTDMCAKYIYKYAGERYFYFLMGKSDTILIEWNGKSDVKSAMFVHVLTPVLPQSHSVTHRAVRCQTAGAYTLVTMSTGHVFSFRLHTAKETIESALSLKWAVQLKNRGELYPKYYLEHYSQSLVASMSKVTL
jgi:hypothetical protein